MVGRFSDAALAQWQAQAVSTPVGTPLKYAYTPDGRLGANAIEYRVSATPVRLEITGSTLLLAFVGGYLVHELLGSSVGSAFKGGIAKRIGGL